MTWLKATKNKKLVMWTGINATDVAKHLTPTIGTSKGHLYQKRNNINSTQKETEEEKLDMTPSPEEKNEYFSLHF